VRAQIAFIVTPKPFSERMTMKWGWNAGAAVQEAHERLRQFILSLHTRNFRTMAYEGNLFRTIALRCLSDPETKKLTLCIVASICGRDRQEARSLAQDFYYHLISTFPNDWVFSPVGSEELFHRYSGAELISSIRDDRSIVEIGRYEASLSNAESRQYLLGAWQLSPYTNELIWRALANSPVSVLFNVMVQPTLLYEVEFNLLKTIADQANETSGSNASLSYRRESKMGAGLLEERLKQLRFPYLVQVHLASNRGVPPFVERVVGSALTYSDQAGDPQPGEFAQLPANNLGYWRDSLLALTPVFGVTGGHKNYQRLRLLSTPTEACAVLRIPYPNEAGLPGVQFTSPE
jgi:hypothetical protein